MSSLPPADDRPRIGLVARIVSTVFACGLIALGLYTVVGERYFARTRRGTEILIEGQAALGPGLGYIALGMVFLWVFARSARAVGWWIALWLCAAVALFLAPVYLR